MTFGVFDASVPLTFADFVVGERGVDLEGRG